MKYAILRLNFENNAHRNEILVLSLFYCGIPSILIISQVLLIFDFSVLFSGKLRKQNKK